ncbi:MAG: hypothetical protein WCQ69_06020 [Bacteroidales bacterium]|jgi:hypothetical protein|nr:hypothetical protein [Bacteroidales bacterium]MDD2264467.1 hypothetical protein [Bacteroidales bacterium]MDD2831702.1 hypothetical protein [Bacteroidales bacterium]MDD3208929.1 hypothetical protein [Bacteroidales bacterium]MDD3697699.1 hypothetical protein [Bacteroidales bacterium]
MKIFSYPFGANDFYIKPDTALAKPTDDFFIPPVCDSLSFAVCYAIKINRLGRSIQERFAHRYYLQVNYGVCLYGHKAHLTGRQTDELSNVNMPLWIPGVSLDYSLSMPRAFLFPEELQAISLIVNKESERYFNIPSKSDICRRIAHLSGFVYVKMGDLLLMELHPPLPVTTGTRIRVLPEVDFMVR